MRTSITLHDNSLVSIQTIHDNVIQMRNRYDIKIRNILAKYNNSWINNEHEIVPSKMSDFDYDLYQSLFEARADMKHIASQLCVLL